MNTVSKKLIAASGLAASVAIGSLMNATHSAGQTAPAQNVPTGSAPVTIVNPLPLPVTGTSTVSGTVNAAQSGAWNVGIVGTPNVTVANTTAAPVVVTDVSKAAARIVEMECSVAIATPSPCVSITPGAANGGAFTVPAGWSFVLTGAEMLPPQGTGNVYIRLLQGPPGSFFIREVWGVATNSAMVQLQFATGIVIQSGHQLSLAYENGGVTPFLVTLHGYLTTI